MGLAKKHVSYPMHKTNSVAGLTLIFSPKRTACVSSFKCNVMPLCIKKGRQTRGKKKNQSLNSFNLFSTQVCFNELQQFQLIGPLTFVESQRALRHNFISLESLWMYCFCVTLPFGKMTQYLENRSTKKLQAACTSDIMYFIYESR